MGLPQDHKSSHLICILNNSASLSIQHAVMRPESVASESKSYPSKDFKNSDCSVRDKSALPAFLVPSVRVLLSKTCFM